VARLVGTVGGQRDAHPLRCDRHRLRRSYRSFIPQGLTGRTIEDLEAESPDAFGLFDFAARSNCWTPIKVITIDESDGALIYARRVDLVAIKPVATGA
jgi:hypothetical protein